MKVFTSSPLFHRSIHIFFYYYQTAQPSIFNLRKAHSVDI